MRVAQYSSDCYRRPLNPVFARVPACQASTSKTPAGSGQHPVSDRGFLRSRAQKGGIGRDK